MKKAIIFLSISLVQACFICSFISLLSIYARDGGFDHAIRIGWPAIFFTAFDMKNDTLNHGSDIGSLVLDFGVAFLIALPIVGTIRSLLK